MSLLSPRLQLRVAQKQILTPGLVQMVTVLQLNRLELKEMINQEMAENPVLEESAEMGEEMTPEEVQALLERERLGDPADSALLQSMSESANGAPDAEYSESAPETGSAADGSRLCRRGSGSRRRTPIRSTRSISVRFFDDYLDPGYKTPSSESVEKPSFETFLSSPVTLAEHLQRQLGDGSSVGGRAGCRHGDHRQSGRRRISPDHASKRSPRAKDMSLRMLPRRSSSCSRSIPPALALATCASAC